MKKLFVVTMILGLASACSSLKPVVCKAEKDVVATAPLKIAAALNCTGIAAIEASVAAAANKVNFCSETLHGSVQGPIGNATCPLFSSFTVNAAATVVIPASWACSPTGLTVPATVVVTQICEQIVPL